MISDLINLKEQLKKDESLSATDKHRRDRIIGKEIVKATADPIKQLRHWLHNVSAAKETELPGYRAHITCRILTIIFIVLGVTAGWLTAMGLLHYDGSQPVNVVNVVAIMVIGQLVLLGFFVLVLLPRKALAWLPGAAGLQRTLQALSPGRLSAWLARALPQNYRETLQTLFGSGKAYQALYGRIQKWVTLWWSQQFAVCFNLGALAGCMYLIVFSDIAFGWSTTLKLDATHLHQVTHWLSGPWADWFPAAAPSPDLIAGTRYFRLKQGILPYATQQFGDDAARLGEWWPFIVACIITYGLLPRLLTLAFTSWRLRSALNDSMLHLPGVPQILHRMRTALVETQALAPEVAAAPVPVLPDIKKPEIGLSGAPGWVVNWAGVNIDQKRLKDLLWREFATAIEDVYDAGGVSSSKQDREVIAKLKHIQKNEQVFILVKSWEPPMMEFTDFLAELRAAIEHRQTIIVIPVDLDGKHLASKENLSWWEKRLQSIGDPWIVIHPLALEAS